jgi:putative ABC transport system permease protein
MLGGLFGLLLIYLGTVLVTNFAGMELVLSLKNIILGLSVSAIIGLVSGLFPAWSASRLNPVDAMRSTF